MQTALLLLAIITTAAFSANVILAHKVGESITRSNPKSPKSTEPHADAERVHDRFTMPTDMALGDPHAESFGEMPLTKESAAVAEKTAGRSLRKMNPLASNPVPINAGSSTVSQKGNDNEVADEAQNTVDETTSKVIGSLDSAKAAVGKEIVI